MFDSPICRNHETSSRNLDKIRPSTQFIRTHKQYWVSRSIPLQLSVMSPPLESRITNCQSTVPLGSLGVYPAKPSIHAQPPLACLSYPEQAWHELYAAASMERHVHMIRSSSDRT